MQAQTSRFGPLEVLEKDIITLPEGVMGFESLFRYCIVDPLDDTMILWLQSLDSPEIAFPIIEPKLFQEDYRVRLSANERQVLRLDYSKGDNRCNTIVYSILTIPQSPHEITVNLKAPIVINVQAQVGKQVVLQENEYSVKRAVRNELLSLMSTSSPSLKKEAEKSAPMSVPLGQIESTVEVSPL